METNPLIVKKTVVEGELSQKVKVLDRPQTAFPAHFNIIYTSCNDHDTSCVVTKLNDKNDPHRNKQRQRHRPRHRHRQRHQGIGIWHKHLALGINMSLNITTKKTHKSPKTHHIGL